METDPDEPPGPGERIEESRGGIQAGFYSLKVEESFFLGALWNFFAERKVFLEGIFGDFSLKQIDSLTERSL